MEQYLDINTINQQDFETPRKHSHSNIIPISVRASRLQQKHNDESEIRMNGEYETPGESKKKAIMNSNTDKWLRSFSQQRNQAELNPIITDIRLLSLHPVDYQLGKASNNKLQTTQQNTSPIGIPFQPYTHTRNNFNNKKPESVIEIRPDLIVSEKNNKSVMLSQREIIQDDKDDPALQNYDKKIQEISNTLLKLKEYKNHLNSFEANNFNMARQRSKSSISNYGQQHKFPQVKQKQLESSMLYSPQQQQYMQNPIQRRKRGKKLKQEELEELEKSILQGMPQEQIANLMAVNMYNKALLKKEENEENITNVISQQNKLLSRMMEQYDKRVKVMQRKIKINSSKINSEKFDENRFERDKLNFQKVYSDAQKRFYQEFSSLERVQVENQIPNQIQEKKKINYQYQKYYKNQFGSKIQQLPMIF